MMMGDLETTKQGICKPSKSLKRNYDSDFPVDDAYRSSLPDIQNKDGSDILGANVPILQVGISNFRLPLTYISEQNEKVQLTTSVTGTVSLAADHKGINMGRIMRIFYHYKNRIFRPELLEEILIHYKKEIHCSRARLKLSFDYPILQKSLRSDLDGWQYYRVAYEGMIDDLNHFRKIIHFDFVYSSACPCSSELAEHAREQRNIYTIPHSQRSKARITLEINQGQSINIEERTGVRQLENSPMGN